MLSLLLPSLGLVGCTSEPHSVEQQCLDDLIADACLLAAVTESQPNPTRYTDMGAILGNIAAAFPVRQEWPPERWTVVYQPKDLPAILHGYSAACDLRYPLACNELGNFLLVEGNAPPAAIGPYRKACELGLERGCRAATELSSKSVLPQ
jgi:hypothetical protein